MTRIPLKQRLKDDIFILDGAMGTQLMAKGIKPGTCFEYLNIENPQLIIDIQKAYIDAGADAVLTSAFGANKISLKKYGHADKVLEINKAAVQNARKAAGENNYVIGDIGACGEFLTPLGTLKPEELKEALTQQVKALIDNGVDGIIIETMTALDEALIAIDAAISVKGDLPILASMAFDKTNRGFVTSMGVELSTAIAAMIEKGINAVGFNCGNVPLGDYETMAQQCVGLVKALGADVSIYCEANAGLPELVGTKAVYSIDPEEYALEMAAIHKAGVNIIGGCCGTTPDHIREIARVLRKK